MDESELERLEKLRKAFEGKSDREFYWALLNEVIKLREEIQRLANRLR